MLNKIILSLVIMSASCSSIDREVMELNDIITYYTGAPINKKGKQVYVIVALEGCGACVQSTIDFVERNINNDNMTFIISGASIKELNMKFKRDIYNKKILYLIKKLMAVKNKLTNSIHPKVFLLDDEIIVNSFDVYYTKSDSLFNITKRFLK